MRRVIENIYRIDTTYKLILSESERSFGSMVCEATYSYTAEETFVVVIC